uniref:Secreted protein n=1 Tax=Setaria viridis TaxID=4556 RepID=A0A4U6TDG5_SETVI|nr:hypothetical protein SEVIR_9G347733v2 [Setaria viridis]
MTFFLGMVCISLFSVQVRCFPHTVSADHMYAVQTDECFTNHQAMWISCILIQQRK